MMISANRRTQRGATLVVGLIMLVLLTLVVTTAFMMSSGNLKAVGNMQFRDEAIAAANVAIEEVIGTNFTAAPTAATVDVDIDRDCGVIKPEVEVLDCVDYRVDVAVPQCIQAVPVAADVSGLSGVTSGVPTSTDFNTVWDVEARVNSVATGAEVTIRQGIRRRITQPQYEASACKTGA